jgi:hypothetical protein
MIRISSGNKCNTNLKRNLRRRLYRLPKGQPVNFHEQPRLAPGPCTPPSLGCIPKMPWLKQSPAHRNQSWPASSVYARASLGFRCAGSFTSAAAVTGSAKSRLKTFSISRRGAREPNEKVTASAPSPTMNFSTSTTPACFKPVKGAQSRLYLHRKSTRATRERSPFG